jgi:hypothetical protein
MGLARSRILAPLAIPTDMNMMGSGWVPPPVRSPLVQMDAHLPLKASRCPHAVSECQGIPRLANVVGLVPVDAATMPAAVTVFCFISAVETEESLGIVRS